MSAANRSLALHCRSLRDSAHAHHASLYPKSRGTHVSFLPLRRLRFCRLAQVIAITSMLTSARSTFAGVIGFETVPGVGVPDPELEIQGQFQSSEGMRFSLLDGGAPIIVKYATPPSAFASGYSTQPNVPANGQSVGEAYLADPHIVAGSTPSPIVIEFTPPVEGTSGVILDIDGLEVFTITAFDASQTPIDSLTLNAGSPGAGDGLAAQWSFYHSSADIAFIQISLTSYGSGNPGYAVDNFQVLPSCAAGPDFDSDGLCDDQDQDDDNDGVIDTDDVCPFTRPELTVDCDGRPLRDCNSDCLLDGADIQCIVTELLG